MDDATDSAAAPDDVLRTPPVGTPVRVHRIPVLLATAQRFSRAVFVQAVVVLVVAVLLVPAAAFFAAGVWAAVVYITTARALLQLVLRYDLTAAFARLYMLDTTLRVGLVSGAYFAAVCSSTVLAAGILGRGRRRTFLLAGLVLTSASGLIFSLGARLTADILRTHYGIAAPALSALFLYALCDAMVVGMLLVDTRPRRRRRRHRWPRRARGAESPGPHATTARVTPMVRFGPAQAQTVPLPQEELDESTPPQPQLQLASEPSILNSAVEDPARSAGASQDAGAQPLAGVGAQTPPSP